MDIAQDTFLKLFSSMAEFRGDSSFGTWVYRLVVNSCLDHKRRSWRLIPMAAEVMAVLRAPGDALHGLLHSEMRGRVQGAVEKLPAEQRIVVVLRYTEGLAYEEIADGAGLLHGDRCVAPQSRPQGAGAAAVASERKLACLIGWNGNWRVDWPRWRRRACWRIKPLGLAYRLSAARFPLALAVAAAVVMIIGGGYAASRTAARRRCQAPADVAAEDAPLKGGFFAGVARPAGHYG